MNDNIPNVDVFKAQGYCCRVCGESFDDCEDEQPPPGAPRQCSQCRCPCYPGCQSDNCTRCWETFAVLAKDGT